MKVERVNMSRDEWKEFLKENKVDERFLQMPGVIERLLRNVKGSLSFNMEIDNGNFNIEYYYDDGYYKHYNLYFSIDDDGIVKVNDCITLNQYGIDVECETGSWIDDFSITKRIDGVIIEKSGNNGTSSYYENYFIDNGNWELIESKLEYIDLKGKNEEIKKDKDINIDKALDKFDKNSKPIIEFYPNTTEWFEKQRKSLKDRLEEYNNPKSKIERIQNRANTMIQRLERQVRGLEEQNKILEDENETLKRRINKIKENVIGKIIMGLKDKNTEKKSQHEDLDQK